MSVRSSSLNLFSLIDTKKNGSAKASTARSDRLLRDAIRDHDEFLIVFGKLGTQGAYRFKDRALRDLFLGKIVHRIDIGERIDYAPHPGNRRITYSRFDHPLAVYDFVDVA